MDGETEVLAFEGFSDSALELQKCFNLLGLAPEVGHETIFFGCRRGDFDALWKYFEQLGVYLKRLRPKATLLVDDFDLAMCSMEDAADRVDEAHTAVQKKAKEADLMKKAG